MKQHNQGGSLLLELIVYMTIIFTMLGMVLLCHHHHRYEYYEFDREANLLFARIKRIQLGTLYGHLQEGIRPNRILIQPHSYGYVDGTKGLIYHQLPPSMRLEFTGRTSQLTFDPETGIGKMYTITLLDESIRYKRTYIFAQQSGRIRWEEHTY